MTMTDIKSMTQEEITDALRAMGEPAFRGKQVFSWLHKGATDFAEMNNLSKPLREKLGKEFTIKMCIRDRCIPVRAAARRQARRRSRPRRTGP